MRKLFLKVLIVFGLFVQSLVADTTTGLVAYYNFDSNITDLIGNTTSTSSGITYSTGHIGQAANFNGTNSWIHTSVTIGANSSYTKSFWFNATSGNGNLVSSAHPGHPVWFSSNGVLSAGNGSNINIVSKEVNLSQWHHGVVSYDSETDLMKLYIDGILVSSATDTIGPSASNIVIGAFKQSTYETLFTGLMDEVRIYSRALSATDVTALYNYIPPIAPLFTTVAGTQTVVDQPYKYYIGMKIGSEPSYTLSASGLPSGITLLDVNNTAIVSTYTGKGLNTNVDGTLATSTFQNPQALTTLSDGTIFVVGANKVRKIDTNGTVSTFAGTSSTGSTDGAGTSATFNGAYDIASDSSGNLYIADGENNKIRKITPDGTVSTFAGSGTIGSADGTGIAATFSRPIGVAVDANGNIFVADTNNNKIRKITPAGVVTTFAGSGTASSVDGTGIAATFNKPEKLTFDKNGDLYVADTTGHKIRKITPVGVVTTIAGSGTAGSTDATGTSATFKYPKGIITDSAGNLYIGDCDNHKIRKITPNGVVTTIAGQATNKDRDGINTVAGFNFPIGLTFDKDGNLLVADNNNHKIKKIVLANYMLSGTPANTGESNITLTATSGTMSISQNFTLDIVSSSLTVGLLAQYGFDNAITDGSGNGYNLTVSGTPAYVNNRNGLASSAYSLTAGSNRLTYQFANDSNYIRTQDNIGTVAFWMKASPQASGASIISMYTGGAENGSFEIYTNATKKLLISPANYGIEGTTTDVGAFDNNWHHIAVVYNGTSKSIYLDGQSVDINNSNYTYNVGPSIMIGHENTASPFTGAVDDIKIYNRALSSAEIALLTEIVFGTSSNDNLSGTTSNDRFVGSDGNDTINGSDGNDTVVYDGNRTSYTVTKNSDGSYTVVKLNSHP
jgi:sugar lactone lactonase YvrE